MNRIQCIAALLAGLLLSIGSLSSQSAVKVRQGKIPALAWSHSVALPFSVSGIDASKVDEVELELEDKSLPYTLVLVGDLQRDGAGYFQNVRLQANGAVPAASRRLAVIALVNGARAQGRLLVETQPVESPIARVTGPPASRLGEPMADLVVRVSTPDEAALRIGGLPVSASVDGQVIGESESIDGLAMFKGLRLPPGTPAPSNVSIDIQDVRSARVLATHRLRAEPAAVTALVVDGLGGKSIVAGIPFPFTVTASANGAPLAEREVRVMSLTPGARWLIDDKEVGGALVARTNGSGVASFPAATLLAAKGTTSLLITADEKSETLELQVRAGAPHAVQILEQPPATFEPGKKLVQAPVVLVEDRAGNALVGVRVEAAILRLANLCSKRIAVARGLDVLHLDGTTQVSTGENGQATFDNLSITSNSGCYKLAFTASKMGDTSRLMYYSAEHTYNRNFVIISAVRSVSGIVPKSEFFDVRFRYRHNTAVHTLINADVGISRKDETDREVKSTQSQFVEGAFWLNFSDSWMQVRDPVTDIPERFTFIGANARVFATVPYIGVHAGSVELAHSIFHGSTATVSYAHSPQRIPVVVEGTSIRPSRHNIAFDGFLRSDAVGFFKLLSVKGTILLPIGEKGRTPTSRITIGVPIGNITTF